MKFNLPLNTSFQSISFTTVRIQNTNAYGTDCMYVGCDENEDRSEKEICMYLLMQR